MDVPYEFGRYRATLGTMRGVLDEYGVAVLPDVLTPAECEDMFDKAWETIESLTLNRVRRDSEESWRLFFDLFPMHGMLLQHFGIGHAQFLWDLRQHPRVYEVFSRIWDTEPADLLVSFDGAAFQPPPETTGRGKFRGSEWLHSDQSFRRNGFECVQGWVTALPVEEGDATLTFLEGSHAHREAFAERFGEGDAKDWRRLTAEETQFFLDAGCERKCIRCPAGSLVLWDSRTVHAGREPTLPRAAPKFRCVGYVCMTPREHAKERDLRKKRQAFYGGRTTSHWPHRPKLFPKGPRTYGKNLPALGELARPQLTALGWRLAGFDRPEDV